MTRSEAVAYFGSVQLVAQLLGISVAAVRQWPDGRIPLLRQHRLAELSHGALAVDGASTLSPLLALHSGTSGGVQPGLDRAASDLIEALLRFHRALADSVRFADSAAPKSPASLDL